MAYNKTNWEAAPSTNTPINPTNLNKIEQGIYDNSLGVENIGNLSNLETTAKTNLVAAINEVKTNLGGKLLWTNSNPSNSFAGQQITLSENITNFDLYEVIFVEYAGNLPYGSSGRIPVDHTTNIGQVANMFVRRSITAINGNKLTFGDGQRCTSFNGSWTTDNVRIIPVYIIGYKLGIFN